MGNPAMTLFNQVGGGGAGAASIVELDAVRWPLVEISIEKDKRDPLVREATQRPLAALDGGQQGAVDPPFAKHLVRLHLPVGGLVGIPDDQAVPGIRGRVGDPSDERGKEGVGAVADDEAEGTAASAPQHSRVDVGRVIQLLGRREDALTDVPVDIRLVIQCPGGGADGDPGTPGDIADAGIHRANHTRDWKRFR
jgi:hypothetical protein